MSHIIELRGQCGSDGEQISFHVEISAAERDGPFSDYVCRVRSPQLFTKSMDIYGVSRHQAVHLALGAVTASLTAKVIRDSDPSGSLEGGGPGEGVSG